MAKYYNKTARKAAQKYMADNCLSVAFRLNKKTESELIEIYQSIPRSKKAAWFKQCLREYAAKNPNK